MSQFISDLGFLNQNQIARFLQKKIPTKLIMAAQGSFNIFSKNYDQPDKRSAVELFSTVCQTNQTQNQRPFIRETISKRQNFGNEIRKKKKEQVKRNIREQLTKALDQNDFLSMLESLASKNSVQPKNFSNFLSDLKRNVNDYDFCKKLDQNNTVKQFLLDNYVSNESEMSLKQKSLLVHCLTILTYFGCGIFQINQKQQLNETMILQLGRIEIWNCETIDYFTKLLDLLTNITADHDKNLNYYLMDTNIFPLISEKITNLSQTAQKILNQHQHQELHINYLEDLNDIRSSLISTLYNLSGYDNEFFFQYTVNQFVNDRNYLEQSGARVMNIFANFFQHSKFRQHFIENSNLVIWFQTQVTSICQKRFLNLESIKTGKFQDVVMQNGEKQLFYQFLCGLINWLNSETDEAYLKMMEVIVQGNLNSYCLSQFLIQSAGQIGSQNRTKRNSIYVAKAIQMYEYLASDPTISLSELLIVTSERTFEDILKVFLDETYFTSCKISDLTISVLNKMISKDHRILNTLMELRILQSIDSFLSKDMKIQTVQQILNFFDLLTLMIASNDEYPKKKHNQIARLLEIQGLVTKIQRYQNHQEKKVGDKVEAFLNFFDTVRQGNTKYELLEI